MNNRKKFKKGTVKNEKAITLIALIVSIIVLLILAGVSIAVLTGENGIINRTTEAKKTTEESEVKENIRLAFNNAQIGRYSGEHSVSDYEAFASTMQADLRKTYTGATVTSNGDGTYVATVNGKAYDVDANGTPTKQGASIVVGEATIKDASGNEVTTKIQGGGTVYIHFTASLTGGTITSVTSTGLSPTLTNNEWVTAVSANGTYTFTINGTTEDGNKTTTKAVTVNKFSNLPSGLKVGSIVTYDPSITTSASGHTFNWEAELCSSMTSDDVSLVLSGTGTNMAVTNWKVLSIDEENETVELISTAPTSNTVDLGQAQGYNNAVYLLNNACNSLYGGTLKKGGTTYPIEGRNVSIKDIEDRMTSNALDSAHSYGSTATWGNTTNAYTSHKYYPTIYYQEVDSKINGNALTGTLDLWTKQTTPIHRTDGVSELQSDGKTLSPKETTHGDGEVQATTSIQPKQTYWYKDNSFMQSAFKATDEEKERGINDGSNQTANYSLLMTNGSGSTATYWLASRCVNLYSSSCDFNVSGVSSGYVDAYYMFDSGHGAGNYTSALRPVVSLSSALLSPNGSNFQIVSNN